MRSSRREPEEKVAWIVGNGGWAIFSLAVRLKFGENWVFKVKSAANLLPKTSAFMAFFALLFTFMRLDAKRHEKPGEPLFKHF